MQDALSLVNDKSAVNQSDQNASFAQDALSEFRTWPEPDQLPLVRLMNRVRQHPGRPYLKQPIGGQVKTYTWGQVYNQAARMACYLNSLGLSSGDRVAIFGKNSAHWIIADYAIWLAGCVSVPIYPTLSAQSVNDIVQHSGAKLVFIGKLDHWESFRGFLPDDVALVGLPLCQDKGLIQWESILDRHDPIESVPETQPEQLATIIYTSGTTGMPKGVMHSFGTLASAAGHAAKIYRVNDRDRVLSYLPLSHVAERLVVELAGLYEGFTVYFTEGLSTFAKDLERAKPTIFFGVPRIWAKFQEGVVQRVPASVFQTVMALPVVNRMARYAIIKKLGLHKVRLCISGAAPLAQHLLQWYKLLGLEILEVYGMTENLGYSHSTREGDQKEGYVGLPNPGVIVKLSETGEVLVASNTSMLGYYREPKLTAEAFADEGFLRTGDIGVLDQSGRLKISGRTKEIFKTSKGKYVVPAPIEARLLQYPQIDQVCVTGENLPQPIALLTLTDQARAECVRDEASFKKQMESFRLRVNEELNKHECLSHWVVVSESWTIETGFLTPTLKLKRPSIEQRYNSLISTLAQHRAGVVIADAVDTQQ